MLGYDPLSPYQLHLYKLSLPNAAPDWALKLSCPSGTCTASYSESLIVSNTIYSFFTYGSTTFLYLAAISVTDGSVIARYKSSSSCDAVNGSGVNGDYIVVSLQTPNCLLIFNMLSYAISIKSFSGAFLYSIDVETSTGRLVVGGQKSTFGYATKFTIQSIPAHPDFQTTDPMTMNVLSTGTEDITLDSSQSIGTASSQSVSAASFTNQTIVYVSQTNNTSDVNFLASDQSFSVVECIISNIIPELPCSISGSTSISFSISNYIASAPSWVTIDSGSGLLTISAPDVASDTEFIFYINSIVSGVSNPIQKIIKLTILNCNPSNCQKCLSTSSSTCEVCSPNYYLDSGVCKLQSASSSSQNEIPISKTSQALSKSTTSAVFAITGVVAITSLINTASIASLWMTINQLQLFFLLLLVRAFIPKDIEAVIKGSDFASNIYEYFPVKQFNFYPSLFKRFEFKQINTSFETLGIKFASTFANITSILTCTFIMTVISTLVCFLRTLFTKFKESKRCVCISKTLFCIVDKLYCVMIFGYFIRNSLEMSQFILISSIYEIYENNTTDSYRSISYTFSILMMLIFFSMLGIILYLIFSSYKINENKHNKLEEFFRGVKHNKKHRLYVVFLLLRKLTFIILLVTCIRISSRVLAIVLTIIQVGYIIYLAYIRPFHEVKGNLIEILNEIYFCFLMFFLAYVNTENEWNSFRTSVYMWVLVSNTFVVFFIVSAFSFKIIWKCICKCCRKCRISKENEARTLPVQPQTIINKSTSQTVNMSELSHPSYMIDLSQGGVHFYVSECRIEESKSISNLNVQEFNLKD